VRRRYKQVTETETKDMFMRIFRYVVILFLFVAPAASLAAVGPGDLPDASKWYIHADFEEMRSSEAGQHLYGWLQEEVFDDIREDVGVDLDKEADTLTAFSVGDGQLVVVIDGRISQQMQDKVLAIGTIAGSLDKLGSGSKTFYHVNDDNIEVDGDNTNIEIDMESFDDGAFFSFAVKNKLLVTSTRKDMESLIANKGRVEASTSSKGALFVLSAERNLMQAGARAGDLGDDIGWDSNILRNTEQAALLIAEKAGKIAIEAQLVTAEKEMADSLASIVRGLISLQIFNDDMDPEVAEFLQNMKVEVEGNTLKVTVALDPEVMVAAIE
jgi:hypothetical protein